MGLGVALLVYLNQPRVIPVDPQTVADIPERTRGNATVERQTTTPESVQRRFDFYTLLPELEVVVPEHQTKPRATTGGASPAQTATASATGAYILQAGSFQRADEADSLKANLALLGVQANIETVTVDDNTWHRVRIGPYADLAKLNQVREQLARNQIDTVLLKKRR
jgi:cell division protein FtsN